MEILKKKIICKYNDYVDVEIGQSNIATENSLNSQTILKALVGIDARNFSFLICFKSKKFYKTALYFSFLCLTQTV